MRRAFLLVLLYSLLSALSHAQVTPPLPVGEEEEGEDDGYANIASENVIVIDDGAEEAAAEAAEDDPVVDVAVDEAGDRATKRTRTNEKSRAWACGQSVAVIRYADLLRSGGSRFSESVTL